MKLIANIIWFIFGGAIAAIIWAFIGLLLCITVIGIPFGLQFFKFAKLVLWPFGKDIETHFEKHPIINIIWLIIGGWETCLLYISVGLIYCITIIGIPFGVQWFKLAILALFPFGARIR